MEPTQKEQAKRITKTAFAVANAALEKHDHFEDCATNALAMIGMLRMIDNPDYAGDVTKHLIRLEGTAVLYQVEAVDVPTERAALAVERAIRAAMLVKAAVEGDAHLVDRRIKSADSLATAAWEDLGSTGALPKAAA